MSDSILDICYEQADISVFEIGSSNISHLDKIISYLDDALIRLERISFNHTDSINELKYLLQLEKNHYSAVSNNQVYFWAYIKKKQMMI